jgi:hypothetical protein
MHDNTCKTNRYNRPLSLFVTSDNNLKTRIVAQAIVDDETQFSYEWVFQFVKEATGVAPKVFVTDGDPAGPRLLLIKVTGQNFKFTSNFTNPSCLIILPYTYSDLFKIILILP